MINRFLNDPATLTGRVRSRKVKQEVFEEQHFKEDPDSRKTGSECGDTDSETVKIEQEIHFDCNFIKTEQ